MNSWLIRFTALMLAATVTAGAQPVNGPAIVIYDVTVIDATGRAAQPHTTVLIANGRIADISQGKQFKLPAGSLAIDGAGKFLIPGLWNMHVHLLGYEPAVKAFPSVLAAGVTGVRDMGSPLADALRVRAEANSSSRGPHLLTSGPLLVRGIPPSMKGTMMLRSLENPGDAAGAVSSLKAGGADFIKVEGSLTREVYFAVAAAARAQKIPFAGHIPPAVGVSEASDLGQRSVEHLGGPQYQILIACSTHETELRSQMSAMTERAIEAAFSGQEPLPEHQRAAFTRAILDSFSESKCRNVIARLKKNRTWQIPTLVALRSVWGGVSLTAEDREDGEKIQQKQFEVVTSMARAGVPLMAGTDGPLSLAGPALQDELQMLVKAGVSTLQALQAATRNAAEFIGRLPELGTIERGKIADLVLVDADPLLDIANLRRVSTVILGGKVVAPVQP